jgi:hypothetical protein
VKQLEATIKAIVVDRPDPDSHPQNLCLDTGYDGRTARGAAEAARYIPQIRRKGEEKLETREKKRYPARRWVVERGKTTRPQGGGDALRRADGVEAGELGPLIGSIPRGYSRKSMEGNDLIWWVEHDREVLERVVRVSDRMRLVW